MPHWWAQLLVAIGNSDNPMRVMVGAITRGPIYLNKSPINPEKPISTSNMAATITAPCS